MKVRHIRIKNFRGIKSLAWSVRGDFNCIIGPGDTGKTTVLVALDYALSPRTSLAVDDSDFFDQDVSQDICIQVTLSEWDEAKEDVRELFKESRYGQRKCGLDDTGPLKEPGTNGVAALSVSLRIDKSLEPKWFVVQGVDDGTSDAVPLYAADRAALGASRLDIASDAQFSWARNSILTRLNAQNEKTNLYGVLSEVARGVRQFDISTYPGVDACQKVADKVKAEAMKSGVNLSALAPKLDVQRQSVSAGALALHENNVPLRNKGSGSKRLIASAMQMQLNSGKNIAVIDEIETGLEPHRIRGLIKRLKDAGQQVFTTTHSPVVLRELAVAAHELYACRRDGAGTVALESFSAVADIQGALRTNAEAFLGGKIIACEGVTEIGCVRAFDLFRFDAQHAPVWSFATAYLDCKGGSSILNTCQQLLSLGYRTAVLCDSDADDQLSDSDTELLARSGVHICKWPGGRSIEGQVFEELPWSDVPAALEVIAQDFEPGWHVSTVDVIRKDARVATQNLGTDPQAWPETAVLRTVIADLAKKCGWIKRIDRAQTFVAFALPKLPEAGVMRKQLGTLWSWVESD